MTQLYFICMAVGILLPLCSVVLNLFDGFVDFVTFDLFHLNFGDFELDLLPLSVNSLCLASLLFGLTGYLMNRRFPVLVSVVTGLICGYFAAVCLQSAIHKIKKYETNAVREEEVFLHDGEVANLIPASGYGAVRVNISRESSPVYPAKSSTGEAIAQNTQVEILSLENGVLTVRPLDWREKNTKIPAMFQKKLKTRRVSVKLARQLFFTVQFVPERLKLKPQGRICHPARIPPQKPLWNGGSYARFSSGNHWYYRCPYYPVRRIFHLQKGAAG